MKLNELLQERAKVYDQLKDLQNKYNDKPMDGADNDTYGNLEKRFDELTASIEGENKKKPLSDQKICDILNDEGIEVSRRTVTKYREELQILTSSLRREV